ncbi:MAG: hypothetical protein U0165_02170 [Polyangiaceae bacterium]
MIRSSKLALWALSLIGLSVLAVSSTGCSDDAYCFTCPPEAQPEARSAAPLARLALREFSTGGSGPIGGSGGTAGGDCGDTQTDPQNCGTCGNVCVRLGSLASCNLGECAYECAPGNVDVNGDLNAPDPSDGCGCAVTNSGIEIWRRPRQQLRRQRRRRF